MKLCFQLEGSEVDQAEQMVLEAITGVAEEPTRDSIWTWCVGRVAMDGVMQLRLLERLVVRRCRRRRVIELLLILLKKLVIRWRCESSKGNVGACRELRGTTAWQSTEGVEWLTRAGMRRVGRLNATV